LTLVKDKDLRYLVLGTKANALGYNLAQQMHACLDEVEKDPTASCVITIAAGNSKTTDNVAFVGTFSGGLDLNTPNEDGFAAFDLALVIAKLLKRLLIFPMTTICVFNGHAVAGGLFLGLCHDFRLMVDHNAIISLPEIHLDMTLSPPYAVILRHLVEP